MTVTQPVTPSGSGDALPLPGPTPVSADRGKQFAATLAAAARPTALHTSSHASPHSAPHGAADPRQGAVRPAGRARAAADAGQPATRPDRTDKTGRTERADRTERGARAGRTDRTAAKQAGTDPGRPVLKPAPRRLDVRPEDPRTDDTAAAEAAARSGAVPTGTTPATPTGVQATAALGGSAATAADPAGGTGTSSTGSGTGEVTGPPLDPTAGRPGAPAGPGTGTGPGTGQGTGQPGGPTAPGSPGLHGDPAPTGPGDPPPAGPGAPGGPAGPVTDFGPVMPGATGAPAPGADLGTTDATAPTTSTAPAPSSALDGRTADPGAGQGAGQGSGTGQGTGQGGAGLDLHGLDPAARPDRTGSADRAGWAALTATQQAGPRSAAPATASADGDARAAVPAAAEPVRGTDPTGTPAAPGQPAAVTGAAAAEPVRGTERAPSAPDTTVVDQVTRHLVSARVLRDGTHHTVLHLAPEHLGELTVTVDVRQGAVRLDVLGSGSALTALGQDLDSLRSQLADAGLDLADVSMRSDDPAADGGRNGQQPTDRQNQPGGAGNAAAEGFDRPGTGRQGRMTDVAAQGRAAGPTSPAEPEPVAATGPSSTSRTGTGLLDVRV